MIVRGRTKNKWHLKRTVTGAASRRPKLLWGVLRIGRHLKTYLTFGYAFDEVPVPSRRITFMNNN